jgi:hypothetical protein
MIKVKYKFQQVHIVMLITLFVGVAFFSILFLSSLKEMLSVKKDNFAVSSTVSFIKEDKQPYRFEQYQDSLNVLNRSVKTRSIAVDIKNSQIVITSASIEFENEVRQTLINLLALDKNLYVVSMCGKLANSCNGQAIEVIVAGENKNAQVVQKEVIEQNEGKKEELPKTAQ